MPIAGLVITVDHRANELGPTMDRLHTFAQLTLGRADGARVPAVLEAADRADFAAQWTALEKIPGVLWLELAYVDYEDETLERTAHLASHRRATQ